MGLLLTSLSTAEEILESRETECTVTCMYSLPNFQCYNNVEWFGETAVYCYVHDRKKKMKFHYIRIFNTKNYVK
jgi:hypothetical protein